jgi:acyl-CoA thioester hydrolase
VTADREPAVRIRVLYADTDAGGIVYNAAYLRFLEAGRAEAIRATGTPYTMVLEHGLQLPVVELNVRYRNPAFYDDVLGVFVTVAGLRRVRVSFAYELRRESDGRLIATARTDHACLDIEHGRVVPIPDWARAGLRSLIPVAAGRSGEGGARAEGSGPSGQRCKD